MHANTIRIQAKSEINDDTSIKLRILETTDIHSYLLNYDYEKKKKTIEYGYNRVASLIQQAKKNIETLYYLMLEM